MSIKTRLDKLSPKPNESDRLRQAQSYWMLLHVVDRNAPDYDETMKQPLPPAPQAFLDAHVYDPNSRETLAKIVMEQNP